MKNIRVVIEYEGTHYHGWQRQKNQITIQGVLEEKIGIITGEKVTVIGSGRTDSGVHAINQVASFKTGTHIADSNLLKAINSMLPYDIVLKSLVEVDNKFHARYDVKSKVYIYKILNRPTRSALYNNYSWHIYGRLDLAAMRKATSSLKGTHDFSSFCSKSCESLNKVRTVMDADLTISDSAVITFSMAADGFLRYMVRTVLGTLVDVGRGKISYDDFLRILEARDRSEAGITAPPQGLFLKDVYY